MRSEDRLRVVGMTTSSRQENSFQGISSPGRSDSTANARVYREPVW
jgi:hypothetical protein